MSYYWLLLDFCPKILGGGRAIFLYLHIACFFRCGQSATWTCAPYLGKFSIFCLFQGDQKMVTDHFTIVVSAIDIF